MYMCLLCCLSRCVHLVKDVLTILLLISSFFLERKEKSGGAGLPLFFFFEAAFIYIYFFFVRSVLNFRRPTFLGVFHSCCLSTFYLHRCSDCSQYVILGCVIRVDRESPLVFLSLPLFPFFFFFFKQSVCFPHLFLFFLTCVSAQHVLCGLGRCLLQCSNGKSFIRV